VLDDLSSGRAENLPDDGVELIEGDIRDYQTVERSMRGVSLVFHQAAMISPASTLHDPGGCYHTNVLGSLNVLRAAHTFDVQRVVLASSAAVYGDSDRPVSEEASTQPLTPYAASKLAMEQAAQLYYSKHGLATTCLRYFNVYGIRQPSDSAYAAVIPAFVFALRNKEVPTIFGDGTQRRDFIHVSDVVRANLQAAESEQAVGAVCNIGSGDSVSVAELAEILQEIMQVAGPPAHAAPREGDIHSSEAVIEQAQAALGFRPEIDLKEGLQSTIEWFRQEEMEATR
jgi:UDP-glucose 4-epimerase